MNRAKQSRWLPVLTAFMLAAGLALPAWASPVEVLSPSEGEEIAGTIEVLARVQPLPGSKLDRVVLVTSTGEMIRMPRQFADTYSVKLDTTKLRNGRQTLQVLAVSRGRDEAVFRADPSEQWKSAIRNSKWDVHVVVTNPYQFYWGDLHAHTSYSDGAWLPEEAYKFARDKASLDFFAVTDHSPLLTFEEYDDTIAQAERFNEPGRFVTLWGIECTEGFGHLNVYMNRIPRLTWNIDDLYRTIGETGLLGHFNHPRPQDPNQTQGRTDFFEFHYVPGADRSMALTELRKPVEEAAYIAMLDAGWHVGAAGCQDNHQPRWGTGSTWTVALAKELTREAILDALWSRRVYSAGDRNLRLTFTLDGEDMGAQIARRAGELSCMVMVDDPDADQVIDQIDLFVDGRIAHTARPGLAKYAWGLPLEFPKGRHYCFVRVMQPGERVSWSSPIWVYAY